MSVDVEARLRRALEARAAQVEPGARTWDTVQARLRRSRQRRVALAGVAAVAAIVAAAVALPALLGGGVVRLDGDAPPVVDQPEPAAREDTGEDTGEGAEAAPEVLVDPEPEGGAGPGRVGASCDAPPMVAAVWTSVGDVWAACWNGLNIPLTAGPAMDRRPALSPGGDALVFERTEPGQDHPVLVYRELAEDAAETVLGGGSLPAFAPDGRLAWLLDAGDGTSVIQVGQPFSEPEFEAGVPYPAAAVRSLHWTPDGERLLYAAGTDGGLAAWSLRPGTGAHQEVLAPADAYLAVAVGHDGTVAAVHETDDGATLEVVALDPAALDGGHARVVRTLSRVEVADPSREGLFLEPAGFLDAWVTSRSGSFMWRRSEEQSWFVGDGATLNLLRAGGLTAATIAYDVDGVAANPSVEFSTPTHDGSVEAEETRRLVIDAASSGDLAALHGLMPPEFRFSSWPWSSRDEAHAYLENKPELVRHLAHLLETQHGVVELTDGLLYVWPRVHALAPAEWTEADIAVLRSLGASDADIEAWRTGEGYTGLRVGISADGVWRFYVAGD